MSSLGIVPFRDPVAMPISTQPVTQYKRTVREHSVKSDQFYERVEHTPTTDGGLRTAANDASA
jgi:hypothetical protein